MAALDAIALEVIHNVSDFVALDDGQCVGVDDDLYKDRGLDSISSFDLKLVIEDAFDIDDIPDNDWVRLVKVQDVIDYVRSRQQVKAKATE